MKRKTNQLERRRIFRIFFWGALIFLFLSTVFFGTNSSIKVWQKQRDIQKLQAKVDALRLENEQLKRENKDLKTNPVTTEKIAREQFGYQKAGEKVYRFLPPAEDTNGKRPKRE